MERNKHEFEPGTGRPNITCIYMFGDAYCGEKRFHSIHNLEPAETSPINASLDGWFKPEPAKQEDDLEVRYAGKSWSWMREHLIKSESERDALKEMMILMVNEVMAYGEIPVPPSIAVVNKALKLIEEK